MPDVNAWLVSGRMTGIDAEARAVAAWRRIQDRPTSITVFRSGVGAQTVRIEHWRGGEVQATTGSVGKESITILGVKDHPTVADTNLRRGDRFVLDGEEYEIELVTEYPGELQAQVERVA